MNGLTSSDAAERLKIFGPNLLPVEKTHPLAVFSSKFWAPIPWVLEFIIAFEIGLDHFLEAGIIFLLLLFNAALSFFQEGRAKQALDLLRNRLDVRARVLRDGNWTSLSAKELVPGDLILIRMGDLFPADGEIQSGNLLIDQSTLTGESQPIEAGAGKKGYAGSIVRHGEAFVRVLSTGKNSYFGRTAEMIRVAAAPSHLGNLIFLIVKYLIVFDVALVSGVFLYSLSQSLPLVEIIPFSLLLLVASVPVALPATFTLATSLGSLELCQKGILVTRLSAIEEAAAMNVLCLDKTGTITKNFLEISSYRIYPPFTKEDLFSLAAFASEEATQDPIDLAILNGAKEASASSYSLARSVEFIPFDPERKYSEAVIFHENRKIRVFKGAPKELLIREEDVQNITEDGSRAIAVAIETEGKKLPVGLIALKDPPREDSRAMIQELSNLGIRLIMLTGDDIATARAIAKMIGLGNKVFSRDDLANQDVLEADVIAGVFPEDKVQIVRELQKRGHVCGMTGDGVNDAPALRQAEVGIAVANATDVAKASASIVLTRAGLSDIAEAVKSSRRIYQRMLTYTINKITKTLEISLLLGLGLVFAHNFIISQLLIVLLLFTNDFVTMSIATDQVSFSKRPDKWDVKKLMLAGGSLSVFMLGLSFSILFIGEKVFSFSNPEIRTLMFLTLVFTGQATVYLVREREGFWHSPPSIWMMVCSVLDLAFVSFLAIQGIFMYPLSGLLVGSLLSAVILYFFMLDFVKRHFFKWAEK